jgi:hypothetical protein
MFSSSKRSNTVCGVWYTPLGWHLQYRFVHVCAASQHVSTTGHTWNTGNCGCTSLYYWRSWHGLHTGSNAWSPGNCRDNVVPTELRCHQLLFLVSHTHTHSSWTTAPIPPNHPTSHPGNPWKQSICTVDTVCNTSSLELLRPSLELHDVRPAIGKSIGCLYKVHWLHQLNTPSLDVTEKVWKDGSGTNGMLDQLV